MSIIVGTFALIITFYLIAQVRGGEMDLRRAFIIFVLLALSLGCVQFALATRNGIAALIGVLLQVSFLVVLIATVVQKVMRASKRR